MPERPRHRRRRRATTARSPSSSSTSPKRTSTLVREEIELAKAEVTEKVGKLLRGSAVGVAAGVFAFLGPDPGHGGIAWLLDEEVFDGNAWPGFFVEAAVFLLIAAAAGCFAYASVKAGSPPVPEQAIEEAKLTKETLEGERADADGDRADRRVSERRPAISERRRRARARRPRPPALPGRTPAQIRRDIEAQRQRARQLGRGAARPRHRADRLAPPGPRAPPQLIVGAAVVGFAVGGLMAAAAAASALLSRATRRRDAADAEQAGADVGAEHGRRSRR